MYEYRNPIYNANGGIDCEINHPILGWVPFTADPSDEVGQAVIAAISPEEIAAYTPPPPAPEDVNAERDRRVLAGKTFTVTGHPDPIPVQGDPTTQMNLLALAQAAQARMAQGDTTTITPYRDDANVIHDLTPPQVFELWSVGAAYVSAIYQASWALKDDPGGIPADYAEDQHWPA